MRKRTPIVIIAAVVVLALPPLVLPLVRPGARVNCRHEEIDIQSGRKRVSLYIWGCRVSRKVQETYLSEILADSVPAGQADWRSVKTFTPGSEHSPTYVYGGAFAQIRELQMVLEMLEWPQEQRIEAAKGLLSAWQEADDDDKAKAYLMELNAKLEQTGATTPRLEPLGP